MNDVEKARQLFFEALRYFDAADYANAESRLREALACAPGNSSILTNLSTVALRREKLDEAREFAAAALAGNPNSIEALMVLTSCHARAEQFADALAGYDRIIAVEPRLAEVHSNRAHALNALERFADALASCDRAITLAPRLADAHTNRGNALVRLERPADALAAFDAALRLQPDLAEARLGRGNALFSLRRHEQALAAYDSAIATGRPLAAAWVGRAATLAGLFRFDEADAALDRAFAIRPDLASAWMCRGDILRPRGRIAEALAAYDRALACDPRLAEAWLARGTTFAELGRHDEALAAYERAAALGAGLASLAAPRLHAKMWLCDWNDLTEESAHLLAEVRNGTAALDPLTVLAVSSSAADQRQANALFVADMVASAGPSPPAGRSSGPRIRIAYLSPDFRDHPVSFLTVGMLEQHDKDAFDVLALSLSTHPTSAMRSRVMRAVTEFIDLEGLTDTAIVERMRGLDIDIAIDIAGLTQGARLNVLAQRVAPIQVSYLGYPGTMGASFIDYIVADPNVIPAAAREHYSERVVHLPDCFQANDSKRAIAATTPARGDVGLPEQAFVFCVFHSSYKLNPQMFAAWMNLLRQVPGSVLWLVGDNRSVIENLRREASSRSVDPDRLVFAGRLPYPDHLARHRLADLFLDTFPFNGGTTTSDALWAGLPVVTVSGEAFASRMSASLLTAVGLRELATASVAEYEALALALARDPRSLADVKARLARNRTTHPLFDTARFTRHMEAAYRAMWERGRRGEPPEAFAVRAID
jgi:predicted O-linked N-acetylglucosamine transferase (SPINDLY family)